MALTVSGPNGLDLTLPSHYSPGAALSRALTEAVRGGLTEASYYVRQDGAVVGRVDRENGLTFVCGKETLDRGVEDANLEGELAGAVLQRPVPVASEASSTRRPGPSRRRTKEENEVAEQKTKSRSTRSSARKRSAARPPRSSAPAQAETAADVSGDELYKALLGQVREAVKGVEAKPNKSNTYTRLLIAGKAFAYVFPPRKGGVALKIPKQLLGVQRELPDGHGFKVTGWGLTRTVKDPQEAPVVAKALAVAAKAVGAK